MRVLGINGVFHDPAAALVVDGTTVAAAEEERFSRRKHGKSSVPFSTWELPEHAAAWCLAHGGIGAAQLDAVAYSYDPRLATRGADVTADNWEPLVPEPEGAQYQQGHRTISLSRRSQSSRNRASP